MALLLTGSRVPMRSSSDASSSSSSSKFTLATTTAKRGKGGKEGKHNAWRNARAFAKTTTSATTTATPSAANDDLTSSSKTSSSAVVFRHHHRTRKSRNDALKPLKAMTNDSEYDESETTPRGDDEGVIDISAISVGDSFDSSSSSLNSSEEEEKVVQEEKPVDAFLDTPPPAFFSSPPEKKAVLPDETLSQTNNDSEVITSLVTTKNQSGGERERFFGTFMLIAVGGLALPIPAYRHFANTTTSLVSGKISQATDFVQQLVPESEKAIARHAAHEAEETGMRDALFLMITAIFCVYAVSKVPGGSPVVGFLLGGALIGPYATGIITHVSQVKVLAEFGVIFLLFNIGLELSYDRLVSMAKFIFGMGALQVIISTLAIASFGVALGGLTLPAALCVGVALAFSSTAVALQVLQDSGESQTRHGRATFSVLLFQDLSVVMVFMLVPLLAGPDASNVGAIALALCKAVAKTVVAVVGIIFAGRAVLKPVYNRIASISDEIMLALTLTCALGTALLTQSLGLSMALRFSPLSCAWYSGKLGVIFAIGPIFNVSRLNCFRAGLYIAPGGEFAFVTFAEAMRVGLLSTTLIAKVSLAVSISMAITPYLAILGQRMAKMKKAGTPQATTIAAQVEGQVEELSGHVIIGGYARMGQIIGEVLSEANVPFVALDTNADNVRIGRKSSKTVFFGDVSSKTVLEAVRADTAAAVVLTTTNEFAVATLRREYPHIDVYVRAKDVQSGLRLEKAGVKVVVDETLGPALLLAERVMLKKASMSRQEVKSQLAKYRKKHGWQTMSYEEFEEQILNIQSPVPPMPPGTTV
ncbi:unnamed protein product [Bathycoccus prasinos]